MIPLRPSLLPLAEQAQYLDPLIQHYGLPMDTFADLSLVAFASRRLYLCYRHIQLPSWHPQLATEGLGMSFLRIQHHVVPRPTFEGAAWLLPKASRHVLALDQASAKALRANQPLTLPPALQAQIQLERGMVLTHYQGISFGCAHWNGSQLQGFFPRRYGHIDMLWPDELP